MKSVTEANLRGARVLLRADFNVPIAGGRVVDDFRIRKTFPTLALLRERGARTIVIAHRGREGETLLPVFELLKKHLGGGISFSQARPGKELLAAVEDMAAGDILLLENIRRFEEEERGDVSFARELSSAADAYVNDAFSVSHRTHASITEVPKLLPSYAGLLLSEEVAQLSRALSPEEPSLAILGGAKFETKEPLIEKLLPLYSSVLVGGALANDFFKARGFEVGSSMVSKNSPAQRMLKEKKIKIPTDVITLRDGESHVAGAAGVGVDERIVDIGPDTGAAWSEDIGKASFVLWNGPMGVYEKGFNQETSRLAQALARSLARAVVGGGDTVAALARLHFDPSRIFLSTGGGAMVEFLVKGTLPGIEALG